MLILGEYGEEIIQNELVDILLLGLIGLDEDGIYNISKLFIELEKKHPAFFKSDTTVSINISIDPEVEELKEKREKVLILEKDKSILQSIYNRDKESMFYKDALGALERAIKKISAEIIEISGDKKLKSAKKIQEKIDKMTKPKHRATRKV